MMNNLNIDRPITGAAEDFFGRSGFAKQIASQCSKLTSHSTVIGVYGKWGEGKTSLLNMVEESLNPGILQIKFNPWFFKDDEDLLQAFFKVLATALGKKLSTNKERVNKIVSDYSNSLMILDVIPNLGIIPSILKGVSKFFIRSPIPNAEVAKGRVNEFIIESGLNIVILIDDIDRLDAREVSTVFRLVKLLADFPRTTYILLFDHDVVARMLAPYYGSNDPKAGYEFLEKVIQLPLVLPKAHSETLLRFVRDKIMQVTSESGADLLKEDKRVDEAFANGLMILLNNPRKVVRFTNALKFTLSILQGEINPVDLLIIESFKTSMPDYYSFLRENRDLFLADYFDERTNQYTNDRDLAVQKMKAVTKSYQEHTTLAIKNLTSQLFPHFVWRDPAEAIHYKRDQLVIQKRICTDEYFDRYFTFALQDEEIPDVHFTNTYLNAADHSLEQLTALIKNDYRKYTPESVAFKLAPHRNDMKGKSAENLILALGLCSDHLKEKQAFGWGNAFSLIALCVDSMIKALTPDRSFAIANEVIVTATNLSFAAEMTARFVMPESKENHHTYFSGVKATEIKTAYVNRLKLIIDEKGFFDAVPEEMMARQLVWWNDVDRSELTGRIYSLLENDPASPLKFLRIFSPTLNSVDAVSMTHKSFKTEFTADKYMLVERIIGASNLYNKLLLRNGDQSFLESVNQIAHQEPVDDNTLIGSFQELYKLHSGIYEEEKRSD